jgi:sugar/nucleoside kinase (ribokinase family)
LKPNEKELVSLVGSAEPDAAEELLKLGVGQVLLSMGARGCCLIRDGVQKYCPAPTIGAVNPVGSGDSFLAGYLYAALKGYSDELSMMIASAAGAANAKVFPAARVKRADIEAVLGYSISNR